MIMVMQVYPNARPTLKAGRTARIVSETKPQESVDVKKSLCHQAETAKQERETKGSLRGNDGSVAATCSSTTDEIE